jgi:glutamate 5-kinase
VVADGSSVEESMVGDGSRLGRGGVASKVAAAKLAAAAGIETFVSWPRDLVQLLADDHAGTRFAPASKAESAFKMWIRHGTRIVSELTIDDGAVAAIRHGGASLLTVGVTTWSSEFQVGDGLLICDRTCRPVARGLAAIDSRVLLDRPRATEVVHRNSMALL